MKLRDMLEAERRQANAAAHAERLQDVPSTMSPLQPFYVKSDGVMSQVARRWWRRVTCRPVIFEDMRETCGCQGELAPDSRHCVRGRLHVGGAKP